LVQGRVSPLDSERDRDPAGRARNARARDDLGRPQPRSAGPTAVTEEPTLPPPDALARAQALLDTNRAFAAHEALESVWKASSGADRDLWRGLAQLCVGITHAMRGNASGAVALLQRSADTLTPYAGTTPHDVDIDGIREWATAAGGDLTLTATPPRLTAGARS
jgi:hypothetical protein